MDVAIYKFNSISNLSFEASNLNTKYLKIIDKIKILENSLTKLEVYCLKFSKVQTPIESLKGFKEKLFLIKQIKTVQSQIFLLRSDIEELDNDISLLSDFCIKLLKGEETPKLPYKFAIKCIIEDYF